MASVRDVSVFIVGMMRSGSTLLETILDAHRYGWGVLGDTFPAIRDG